MSKRLVLGGLIVRICRIGHVAVLVDLEVSSVEVSGMEAI